METRPHSLTAPASPTELAWLAGILRGEIPLGQAMALEIRRLDQQGIVLNAPLAPNRNDKGTAFGGALASLMILAGWSLPRLLIERAEVAAELVIGRCQLEFLKPLRADLEAVCAWPESAQLTRFFDRLSSRGRAGLDLEVVVIDDGEAVARLSARYAALGLQP